MSFIFPSLRLNAAILALSMIMLPVNANAFWLDIVKEFVSGGIKTVVMPKGIMAALATPAAESKPAASAPAPAPAPKSSEPTPEDIYQALSRLESIVNNNKNS